MTVNYVNYTVFSSKVGQTDKNDKGQQLFIVARLPLLKIACKILNGMLMKKRKDIPKSVQHNIKFNLFLPEAPIQRELFY